MPRNWQRAGAAVKGAGSDGGASENRPMNPGHPGRLSTSGSGKYRRIGPQPAGGARDEPARDRVAGRVAEAQEGAARPREGADPADRPAERRPPAPADGGGDQGLRIRGTGGPREPAGHVPGPSPARAAALHVRPSWDEGCSSCTAGVDEPPAWTDSSCWRTSPVSSAESASSCATATTSSTPTRRSPAAPRCSAAPTPFSTSPRWAGRKNGRSPRAVPPPRARQSPTSRPEPEPDRPAGAGRTAGFSGRAVDLGQGHPLGG